MVNYQLYHTNIALAGQLKWDIVIENTTNGLIVTNFGLSPISRNITYNPKPVNDLLNYSHTDNLIQYYKEMSSKFWDNGEDPYLKGPWPVITDTPKDTHYGCIELGCRRDRYSTYEKQFEFLVPCWLEKLGKNEMGEQAVLQFTLYLCSKNQVIAAKTLELEHKAGCEIHNRFVDYFLEYADKIGINGEGNDKVMHINLARHKAFVMGTDLKSGEFVKRDVSLSLISNILRRERPLMDVDGMIVDCFANNHIIVPQLFNFCLHFNPAELLSSAVAEMVYSKGFNIRIRTSVQRAKIDSTKDGSTGEFEKLPLRDIYSNYDYIPRGFQSIIDFQEYSDRKDDTPIDDSDITDTLSYPSIGEVSSISLSEHIEKYATLVAPVATLTTPGLASDDTISVADKTDDDIYSKTIPEDETLDSDDNVKSSYTYGREIVHTIPMEESNVLSYMSDHRYVGTISKNRICPRICHWSASENPKNIFNLYGGFGDIVDCGGVVEDGELKDKYLIRAHHMQGTADLWAREYSPSGNNTQWLPNLFLTTEKWREWMVDYQQNRYDVAYELAIQPSTWGKSIKRFSYVDQSDNEIPYRFLIVTPPTNKIQTLIPGLGEIAGNKYGAIFNYPAYRLPFKEDTATQQPIHNFCPFWSGSVGAEVYQPNDKGELVWKQSSGQYEADFRSFDSTNAKEYIKGLLGDVREYLKEDWDSMKEYLDRAEVGLASAQKVFEEKQKDPAARRSELSTLLRTIHQWEEAIDEIQKIIQARVDDIKRFLESLWVKAGDLKIENLKESWKDIEGQVNNQLNNMITDENLLFGMPQNQLGLVVLTARMPDDKLGEKSSTPQGEVYDGWSKAMNSLTFANVKQSVTNFYYFYNAVHALVLGHYEGEELVPCTLNQKIEVAFNGEPTSAVVKRPIFENDVVTIFGTDTGAVISQAEYGGMLSESYFMLPLSILYHYVQDVIEPGVIPFSKSLLLTKADSPSVKANEVDYYKNDDVDSNLNFVIRYGGYLKPSLIAPSDIYKNYIYYKEQWASKENEYGIPLLADSAYAKYTPTKHLPNYPSVNYYAIQPIDINYSPDASIPEQIPWFVRLNSFEYNWFLVGWHYLLRPKLDFYLRQTIKPDATPKKIHEMAVEYLQEMYDVSKELAEYFASCYNIKSYYDYVEKTKEVIDAEGNTKTVRYTDLNDYVYRLKLVLK